MGCGVRLVVTTSSGDDATAFGTRNRQPRHKSAIHIYRRGVWHRPPCSITRSLDRHAEEAAGGITLPEESSELLRSRLIPFYLDDRSSKKRESELLKETNAIKTEEQWAVTILKGYGRWSSTDPLISLVPGIRPLVMQGSSSERRTQRDTSTTKAIRFLQILHGRRRKPSSTVLVM